MSLRRLRKSEIRELSEGLGIDIEKRDDVQASDDALLINGSLSFVRAEGRDGWVPAIPLLQKRPDLLPVLIVDMGAVRFVARGADIMRPGITDIPDAPAGALVQIQDERNKKTLAVGEMLLPGEEMRAAGSGRAVRSLHFVGDRLWQEHVH